MIAKKLVSAYMQPLAPLDTGMRPAGKLSRPVACILFDIYGTLFISGSGDIGAAGCAPRQRGRLAKLLRRYGLNDDPDAIVQRLTARVKEEHRRIRDGGVDYPEICIDDIWMGLLNFPHLERARNFAVEFEFIVNPVCPMPNIGALLSFCRSRGLTMGIISNAQFYTPYLFHWFLNASLGKLGIDPRLTFFSYRFGVAKPSLTLFQRAAAQLKMRGIASDSVVYVGNDMRNDILPASATGFMTALFAGDRRSLRLRKDDPSCRLLTPDLVITDLGQLIEHC